MATTTLRLAQANVAPHEAHASVLAPLTNAYADMRAEFDRLAAVATSTPDSIDAALTAATQRFHRHAAAEDALLWPLLRGRVAYSDAHLDDLTDARDRIERLLALAADPTGPAAGRAALLAEIQRRVHAYLDNMEGLALPLLARQAPPEQTSADTARDAGRHIEDRLRQIGYGFFTRGGRSHRASRRAGTDGGANARAVPAQTTSHPHA